MKVLSLFDGMSCGMQALKNLGVPVTEYHAFEIDKYAIAVSKKNHPEIIQHGSVVGADFSQFKDFDLLLAGSPCQGFSFAGKQLAFDDPRSKLFFEFVRALQEAKPKNFMLENVNMKKEYLDVISQYCGVKPVMVNSNLVSAQNRKRWYWSNLPITQPKDKGILLKDIVQSGIVDTKKSYCLDANYWKGGNLKSYFEKHRRQLIFFKGRGNNISGFRAINGKVPSLTSCSWEQNNFLADKTGYRKLTPIECERLQNLEDNYTLCDGVSNTQRYKMCGNGWNLGSIENNLKSLKKEVEK